MGKITKIQVLGWGFHQVEFESQEVEARVLQLSPLALRSAHAYS